MLEGSLPDCMRVALLGDRKAAWHESCEAYSHDDIERFDIGVGPISSWREDEHGISLPMTLYEDWEWDKTTDDPDEAERLWAEAQERLRA